MARETINGISVPIPGTGEPAEFQNELRLFATDLSTAVEDLVPGEVVEALAADSTPAAAAAAAATTAVTNEIATRPTLPKSIDVVTGVLARIDAADGTATWLQANNVDGGPTAWAAALAKTALGIPASGTLLTDADPSLPRRQAVIEDVLARIDAADGSATWLQARASDGGPTDWALGLIQSRLTLSSTYAHRLNVDGSTTDISLVAGAAQAAGHKHLVIPAGTWPALTTMNLSNVVLEFEPGAEVALNMSGTAGYDFTNVLLIEPRWTSTVYTSGPTNANKTTTDYSYPSREGRLRAGCRVLGDLHHKYAVTGVHITDPDVGFFGDVYCSNIRHRTGWGNAFHVDTANAHDVFVLGKVYVEDSDRALETEDGCYDIDIAVVHGKNVFPNGYVGQPTDATGPDGAPYASYSFCADMHAHDPAITSGGGNGPRRVRIGKVIAENCAGAVTMVRSNGTNEAQLPRDCHVGEVHIIGRGMATGYEDVAMGGLNCHVGLVTFDVGSGVAGGVFRVRAQAAPYVRGNTIEKIAGTDAALAILTVDSAGGSLTVGGVPALRSPSGRFIALGAGTATINTGNGVLNLAPEYLPYPIRIDQAGVEIVAPGEASSVVRVAIYSDAGGIPGDPIVDTSVAANSIGSPMAGLGGTKVIGPGLIWRGGAIQGAPTTPPTVRSSPGNPTAPIMAATAAALSGGAGAHSKSGVAGALPAFGTTPAPTPSAPQVRVRIV